MRPETLEAIEFGQVLDWLAELTHSGPGAQAALDLRPGLTPQEALAGWDLIGQARAALDVSEGPDLRDHSDLRPILSSLGPEGSRLDVREFRAVGLEAKASAQALAWLAPRAESSPGLAAIASGLSPFGELIDGIDRTFGPDGEILDSASPRLASLRREISSARSALSIKLGELIRSEEYRPLLMDELVTTRNDRFVIPVRASATGKNRGMVHDWSNSGATAYLEPMETVEDNNRLALIKKEEKREIDRILTRLSSLCRELAPGLTQAGAALTKLDLTLAEARLARLWRAWPPAWAPGQGFDLVSARHPMLERRLSGLGRHMVPLDIAISPLKPLAVISGVNAGGKTVALKTLGLAVALSLCGIVPPVGEGSRLDFPRDMVTVMGDGQDLGSDLSTFSGHVKALGEALDAAGPGVLVLVDEIGSGTDPAEGAALGLAALERFLPSGALILAATHFHLIKSWAALTEGVVSISVNAASSGHPAYGLSYGAPGFSGGLVMARRLGLPGPLIDRAEGLLDDGQRRAMDLLKKLDEERAALSSERAALTAERALLERTRAEAGAEAGRLRQEHARLARELDSRVKSALAQTRLEREALKREIRETLAQGRRPDPVATSVSFARLEKALAGARPEGTPEGPNEPLARAAQGTEAFLPSLGRVGVVMDANEERDEYRVNVGGMTVKVGLSGLFKPRAADRKTARSGPLVLAPDPGGMTLSINLIGKTVDEAEAALEIEIDRAILRGQNRLTVIHGLGTGRLRRGISEYLRRHPQVLGFSQPGDIPGGAGVTEVELQGGEGR
ncbi:MAG: Smr/MutS family protein [Deltaproteobacteria bacterium]|jgi:DNA mismatch repair protein MutS2|nr:Smr/MutS family protein [Deltaproteobacteria bacterium]